MPRSFIVAIHVCISAVYTYMFVMHCSALSHHALVLISYVRTMLLSSRNQTRMIMRPYLNITITAMMMITTTTAEAMQAAHTDPALVEAINRR